MIWSGIVQANLSGLAFFDLDLLKERYGPKLRKGSNLLKRYTTTDEGDSVIREGLVLPILSIKDDDYMVVVRTKDEEWGRPQKSVLKTGIFPLRVQNQLVVTDLSDLNYWSGEGDWLTIPAAPGYYSVTVHGYEVEGEQDLGGCYELVLVPQETIPHLTADPYAEMDIETLATKPNPDPK